MGGFGHGRRFVSTEAHTKWDGERKKRESKKGKVKENERIKGKENRERDM